MALNILYKRLTIMCCLPPFPLCAAAGRPGVPVCGICVREGVGQAGEDAAGGCGELPGVSVTERIIGLK